MKNNKRLLCCLVIVLGAAFKCYGQNVYTIAGTGVGGYSGDGGLANAAKLDAPTGIAIDGNCNLYFSDFTNHKIRKVDARTGIVTTLASVDWVYDLEMDANNNLYASATNFSNNTNVIYKIDINNGAVTTVKTFGYNGVFGIGVDGAGYIYARDQHTIIKIDPNNPATAPVVAGNGTSTYSGDGGPATSAGIGDVLDIAIDASGNFYLFQASSAVIRKVNTAGIISTYAGTGVSGFSGDGGPATSAQLSHFTLSSFILLDPNGDLLLGDGGNDRVRKINTSTGIINTIAGFGSFGYGGDGGPLSAAVFHGIADIAFDKAGNLFLADYYNDRIRMACMSSASSTSASITASPGNVVCTNTPVTFTASINSPICYVDYKWYKVRGGTTMHVGNGPVYTDYAPKTGDDVYCKVNASSHPINAICNGLSTAATSNTITMVVGGFNITGVDINTRCVPGASSPSKTPQFQIFIEGGTSPVNFNWMPQALNSATLNNTAVSDPEVTAAVHDGYADYLVQISDASGCPDQFLHVQTQFTNVQAPDMASKDSPWDLYMEPNNQVELDPSHWNIWLSPDVWNRLAMDNGDEHLDAEYSSAGSTNHVYERIRNVGCITSPVCTTMTYWTMGGMAEAWPNDWTTSIFNGPNGPKPQGQPIVWSKTSLSPAPGYSLKSGFPWTPPNPQDYFSGSGVMDVCFLSRIEDSLGMTFPEVDRVSDNVRKNNNIVTRNFKVIKLGPKAGHAGLMVGSADNVSAISLEFINEANFVTGASSYLNQYVSIVVSLGDLFNIWVNGGAVGTYSAVNYTDRTVTFDGTNTMRLDNIVVEGIVQYPVEIRFIPLAGVDIIQMPEEIVHFRQLYVNTLGNEEVYGNFSFQMKYDRSEEEGDTGEKNAALDNKEVFGQQSDVRVYPNPARSEVNFELPRACHATIKITDLNGRVLQTTQSDSRIINLKLQNYIPGIYTYQVITDDMNKTGKIVIRP